MPVIVRVGGRIAPAIAVQDIQLRIGMTPVSEQTQKECKALETRNFVNNFKKTKCVENDLVRIHCRAQGFRSLQVVVEGVGSSAR